MPPARTFPRRTLENALRVPEAIKEHNAGNPWSSEEVAKALDLGPRSGNYFYVTAASRDYGLTEGSRDTAEISLTPLGQRAVYPSSPEEEAEAHLEAFLNVEKFKQVLEYYGGNNLPERQFLSNTLTTTFDLPEEQHDEFVDLFQKNCRFLGIGESYKGGPARGRRHVRDRVEQDGGSGPRDVVTIATPEDADDAPVCFVIMPFVEREDTHAVGFFDEVIESLFTPAAKAAGFRVRTAMRQGTDLIQSTIVNDLLEADLVLCDLTEHNPNVLFELGLRMREEKPVALVKARGTGRVFDVDNMLRVIEYSPNLWPSTVAEDIPKLEQHLRATWNNRDSDRTFMKILRRQSD